MNATKIIPVNGLNRKQLTILAWELGTTPKKLKHDGIQEPESPKQKTMLRQKLERFDSIRR